MLNSQMSRCGGVLAGSVSSTTYAIQRASGETTGQKLFLPSEVSCLAGRGPAGVAPAGGTSATYSSVLLPPRSEAKTRRSLAAAVGAGATGVGAGATAVRAGDGATVATT